MAPWKMKEVCHTCSLHGLEKFCLGHIDRVGLHHAFMLFCFQLGQSLFFLHSKITITIIFFPLPFLSKWIFFISTHEFCLVIFSKFSPSSQWDECWEWMTVWCLVICWVRAQHILRFYSPHQWWMPLAVHGLHQL